MNKFIQYKKNVTKNAFFASFKIEFEFFIIFGRSKNAFIQKKID